MTWQPPEGALSYDVLLTTTSATPSGSCGCAAATGVTGTSTTVTTNTTTSYTLTAVDPNAYAITSNNKQFAAGESKITYSVASSAKPLASLDTTGNWQAQSLTAIPKTVASLPLYTGGGPGTWVNVSDGVSATDCTAGGGTTTVPCYYANGVWTALGQGGGGGGGSAAGPQYAVQFNFPTGTFAGVSGFTYNASTKLVTVPSMQGGSSSPNIVNALSNPYGAVMVGDGATDNCAAFNTLEAAVPSGGALYVPGSSSLYHFSTSTCPNGAVVTRPNLIIYGDGSGYWTGTTFAGGTLFDAPLVSNLNANVGFEHMAVDLGGPSSSNPASTCFSSGAAQTGSMYGVFYDLKCQGSAVLGHGVLAQSGGGNFIDRIWSYNVYHAWAVRSSDTIVGSTYGWNNTDAIVKGDPTSGAVATVSVGSVTFDGSSSGSAGGMFVTSDDPTAPTSNVAIGQVIANNSAYCAVVQSSSGGVIDTVNFGSITCSNSQNGYYLQFVGPSYGQIARVDVGRLSVTTASGTGAQNGDGTHTCTTCSIDSFELNSVTTPMVYSFYQSKNTGIDVTTGNPGDTDFFTSSVLASQATIGFGANIPTGVSTCGSGSSPCFDQNTMLFGATEADGNPGVAFLGSTAPAARNGQTGSQIAQLGAVGNNTTDALWFFGGSGSGQARLRSRRSSPMPRWAPGSSSGRTVIPSAVTWPGYFRTPPAASMSPT